MIRLVVRLSTLSWLLGDISGSVPDIPLPARCKVLRLDIANKHDGKDPWNECLLLLLLLLLLLQLDPTPAPSMIKLVIFDLHILNGIVPVIQFDDRTIVFRFGMLVNNNDGNEPVRLMEDRTMYFRLFVVLILNNNYKLPPRNWLVDRSILIRLDITKILFGIVPIRLLSCK